MSSMFPNLYHKKSTKKNVGKYTSPMYGMRHFYHQPEQIESNPEPFPQ